MQPCCTKLCNRTDAPVDFSVLNGVHKRTTELGCDLLPSMDELKKPIKKMANGKKPGESGMPAEALKALPDEGFEALQGMVANLLDH